MIDTVRFRTPINGNQKKLVEQIGRRTESYDMATGEIYYSFTNVNLKGSWETSIQLKVNEKVMINSKQYYMLYVECSLHKLILGHNCYGGSDDLRKQLVYLQDILFKELYIFIDLKEITITRIDYAYVWKLKNQQQSINFIKQLHKVPYRGKTPKPWKTSSFWKLTNWSMKVYDKLADFQTHDMKKSNFTQKFYNELPGILRFEITFRKKKLEDLHKKKNLQLEDINILLLKEFVDEKILYIEEFIGDKKDYNRLNTFEKVMNTLNNSKTLKKGMASRLLTTYTIINNIGLDGYQNMTKQNTTYYRHVKLLKQHGIDVANGTIDLKTKYVQKLYPEDFKMSESKYKIESQDLDNYLMVAI